jgi:hypothetical protein
MATDADKAAQFVTRYVDGAGRGIAFLDGTRLAIAYARKDGEKSTTWIVDLRDGTVTKAKAKGAVMDGEGALGWCDVVAGRAALTGEAAIEVRDLGKNAKTNRATGDVTVDDVTRERCAKLGRALKRIERAGKYPRLRLSDDGAVVHASASDVLSVFDVKTGKCTRKVKCWDKVTHVAAHEGMLAAQNKEGVVCLFADDDAKKRISLRLASEGWLAFADDGAYDCSDGFSRGIELSWTDARSFAFTPDVGVGKLDLNMLPLVDVVACKRGRTPGLLALLRS